MARVVNTTVVEANEELAELNSRERTAERERFKALFNKRSELASLLLPLETTESAMLKERKMEHDEIKTTVVDVYGLVKQFTNQVKNVKPNPDYVQQVQNHMQLIEQSFSETKQREKTRFDALLREQYILETELIMLDRRIQNWYDKQHGGATAKQNQTGGRAAVRSTDIPPNKNMPPEVIEYEKFISRTGVRNGWDIHDHEDFVRMRTRFGGRHEFIRTLAELMVTRTYDEIVEHETWYRELIRLEMARREAIKRWKAQRNSLANNSNKRGATDLDESSGESDNDSARNVDEQTRKRKETERRQREEQRERLAEWKRNKMQQRERERAEAESRAQRDSERQRQENERRAQTIRERILSHREEQRELESAQRDQEKRRQDLEEAQRRLEIQQKSERVAERNMRALEQKLVRAARKRRELEERELRLAELKRDVAVLHVVRDPQRLLEPTTLWKERLKSVGVSDSAGRIYTPINKIPHLGVPSWRK